MADVTVYCQPGDYDTYIHLDFLPNAGPYAHLMDVGAWCIDTSRLVYCNESWSVDMYSSYDYPNIPDSAIDKPENLDMANWLINNLPIGTPVNISGCYEGPVSWEDYQMAMWSLIDDADRDDINNKPNFTECITDWIIAQAETHGDGYEVPCDDPDAKIGAVLVIDNDEGYIGKQVMMAEIPLKDIEGVCDCDPSASGDPHFKTWAGELYDFHGVCDLSLLRNPQFMNGLGMDIDVRSKKMKQFSHISTAAIRIGSETFEVAGHKAGDTYWLNGIEGGSGGVLREGSSIAGYSITFRQVHSHQREYSIHISDREQIVFGVWKDFVRVDIKGASGHNFQGSLGLMGSFDQNGVKVGRDGVTVYHDVNKFGMEWQVLSSEAKLFHEAVGPQHPAVCEVPTTNSLRRRLVEATIGLSEAELACAHVSAKERSLCTFDVMATGEKNVAMAYGTN